MPYRSNTNLPPSVRHHLPRMRRLFAAPLFNSAFASHDDVRQEEIAHRTAWTAVKRSYVKVGDYWVEADHQHWSRREDGNVFQSLAKMVQQGQIDGWHSHPDRRQHPCDDVGEIPRLCRDYDCHTHPLARRRHRESVIRRVVCLCCAR